MDPDQAELADGEGRGRLLGGDVQVPLRTSVDAVVVMAAPTGSRRRAGRRAAGGGWRTSPGR